MGYDSRKMASRSTSHSSSSGVESKALQGVEQWPKTTYKGLNVFDIYNKNMSTLGRQLNIGDEWVETIEDEEGDEYEERMSQDGQEVYLGYDPKDDVFISGWDIWAGDDTQCGIVKFRIQSGGDIVILQSSDHYVRNLFYGKNGGHKKLEKEIPGLVDIRLD